MRHSRRKCALLAWAVALCAPQLGGSAAASSPAATSPPAFGPPVKVIETTCGGCYEPSVAVDKAGRVFVMAYGADRIAVSDDGGETFRQVAGPPKTFPVFGDAILHVDGGGHLFVIGLGFPIGVQVSRSSDGGRTWDANTFFPAPDADRPWIATGPDGRVYVAFKVNSVELVYRSDDGGVSFGLPAIVAPPGDTVQIAGPLVVDAGGRLLQPMFTGGLLTSNALQVAVSDDGGRSFAFHNVYDPPSGGAGGYFPIPSVGTDGVRRLAWVRTSDTAPEAGNEVLVASSGNRGSTWSDPVRWAGPPVVASPWIAANGGALDVAWYKLTGGGTTTSLLFARGAPDGSSIESTTVAAGIVGRPTMPAPQNSANTDFAHFAHLPDGRAVVVWSDGAVWLSVESPSRGRTRAHHPPR